MRHEGAGLGTIGVARGGRGRLARSSDDLRAAVADWLAKPGTMVIDARIAKTVVPLLNRRVHYNRDE